MRDRYRVLVGRPDLALVVHATDNDFDILAIGSRGRGVSKLLMGSVARHVSESARIPVLIANSRKNR